MEKHLCHQSMPAIMENMEVLFVKACPDLLISEKKKCHDALFSVNSNTSYVPSTE